LREPRLALPIEGFGVTARTRFVVVLVAALLSAALTARLGVWQLSRASQKIAMQTAIESRAKLPEMPMAELVVSHDDAAALDSLDYRRTRLRGQWVSSATVFLDNRPMSGRVGFFVVTPLRLEGRNDAVLVQRGWVPRDQLDRTRLPDLHTPTGTVEVVGRIAPAPGRLYEFSASASGTIRQNLDPTSYAAELGMALRPWSILQDEPEQVLVQGADDAARSTAASSSRSDGLLRQWPLPALDVQKHYGYAFQWFAMCALIAGLYVWFQLLRPWLRSRRDVDA
jgi:surfeit locus 1 family protein